MDLKKVLAQLHSERDGLDAAITNLERLDHSRHPGPGRPTGLVIKSSTNGTSHDYSPPPPTPGH